LALAEGGQVAETQQRRRLGELAAVHDQVYAALRDALLTGRIAPGDGMSLRTLAAELGVSPMPVRDAVRRLVAEGALVANQANKRLSAPTPTPERLEQLALARGWIEPELAARAAERADEDLVKALMELDAQVDAAIVAGDVQGYMSANHAFHFTLYRSARADVLLSMASGLWLQVGPLMRVVFGRLGTMSLSADHHAEVMEALRRRDPPAARTALAADIAEGISSMRAAVAEAAP
jgi:DNA-binding GntR family transcriptional regulator